MPVKAQEDKAFYKLLLDCPRLNTYILVFKAQDSSYSDQQKLRTRTRIFTNRTQKQIQKLAHSCHTKSVQLTQGQQEASRKPRNNHVWQNLLRQKLSNKGSHKWQYSECLKVIRWAAASLLWAARSQEPLYLLWSGCISSFQLQPQCPPWFAKQTTLAGRHLYSVSIFQDKTS